MRRLRRQNNLPILILLLVSVLSLHNCASGQRRGSNSHGYGGSYSEAGNRILQVAKKTLGVPYVFGGKSMKGFDCSGLTSWVYEKSLGIRLPRTAQLQSSVGRRARPVRPGDLLFFHTDRAGISHVGIYVGRGRFVHAPGRNKKVKVDSLKNSYWKKAYRFAKSYSRR